MKKIEQNNNVSANASGLITWTGKDIPCLDIYTGCNLNTVMYKVANAVCMALDPYDLSNLTLQCALDIFNKNEPKNRTIANVFQLLIDNDCSFKELIDNLQDQIDGITSPTFILDLKCLAVKDSFGNTLPYTQQTVSQIFVNEICSLKGDVANIAGELGVIKQNINELIANPYVTPEPIVTTCLSTNKPVSTALITLAQSHCDYKTTAGSVVDIQQAISQQPPELNTDLIAVPGWNLSVTSGFQSLSNLWLAYKNLLDRVILIEDNCCSISCKDVTIGFTIVPNDNNTGIVLQFSEVAGTDIPNGMEDCGSTVTITDWTGNSLPYAIEVSQGGNTEELSIIGLDTSQKLKVNVSASLCSSEAGLNCTKCIFKEFMLPQTCCTIKNVTESDIIIVYTINI